MLNKKLQGALEYIMILSAVIIVVIIAVVGYMYSAHNVKVGSFDEIISAQASSSNTLLLELSELLPPGAQIKGINFTGVPSGTSISVSLENQTPVYNDGYPEYSFSVSDLLLTPLTYYNVSDLVYEVNGKTIAVATSTGEPMAIEGTNGYNGGSSTLPSGIIAYVPITISNNQNVATPSPFQQMIQINEGNYANYIAYNGNIANFEFFTQSGSVLPAWIESNNSGTLTVWVRLPNGIPANSNSVIYLGFASKTTNLLSSSGTSGIGEAPQLSCPNPDNTANCQIYAEYDDGASVFNFYDNFAGTTISSAWTQIKDTWTEITQNNGITITIPNIYPFWNYGGLILTNGFTGIQIFEGDVTAVSGITAGLSLQIGNSSSSNGYSLVTFEGSVGYGSMSGGGSLYFNPNLQISTGIMGGAWTSSSSQMWYENYVATPGSLNNHPLPSTIYPSIGLYLDSRDASISFQWVRTRNYPPNGIMPSVSFGSVQQD